jgi:hypothetical protein
LYDDGIAANTFEELTDEHLEASNVAIELEEAVALPVPDSDDDGADDGADDGDEPTFPIFYKNVKNKTKTSLVQSTNMVDNLRGQVQALEGIPPSQQRLIFACKLLEDGKS